MVALEAMERARPVIAAAIGGLGELVSDGETGLLVAPGEAEPLAASDRPRSRATSSSRRGWARRAGAARSRTFLEERCTERTELALPRGARGPLVDRERSRRHPLDTELLLGAGAPELAVALSLALPRRGGSSTFSASFAASSGGERRPVIPSRTSSGAAPVSTAATGFPASIASSSASPKPSQRAGWTSTVAPEV